MKALNRQCPFSSPCGLLGNIPDYRTKGFAVENADSWKVHHVLFSSPWLLALHKYFCSQGIQVQSPRGRVGGIGFKYHRACKPTYAIRTCQQTVIVGPVMQDGVYHAVVVRQPNTSTPTGYQRSFNQFWGIKLESMAEEEGQAGVSSECCTHAADENLGG